MNGGVLFCLLIAHLLGDFVFQSQDVVNKRRSTVWRTRLYANVKHASISAALSGVLLFYYCWTFWILVPIMIVFLSHGIIDVIKSNIVAANKPSLRYSILMFSLDQIVHFSVLVAIARSINKYIRFSAPLMNIKNWVQKIFYECVTNVTYNQKLMICFILLVIGLWGVGVFIRLFVDRMKLKPYRRAVDLGIILANNTNGNGIRDGGFLIGILERLVIIVAVVTNMVNVIGFLVTAKSIARFKKFDDDSFVEYFIIGSFMSIISAVIIGLLIKALNLFPY